MTIETHKVIEDGKVVSAGVCTLWLQYSQILNDVLTLFITICTSIYVGRRAFKTIVETVKDIKQFYKKRR
jgi:hypothetical protein